jgi:nuclear GTP-binding protein
MKPATAGEPRRSTKGVKRAPHVVSKSADNPDRKLPNK